MSSVAPCILAASPLLLDPNFLHAVVLIVEHDEEGAMGLVLNRPLPLPLAKICEESGLEYKGSEGATAFRGGPVEPQRGVILVRGGLPEPEDMVLDFTDFVSFRKDLLEALLLDAEAHYRLFLGYAGWGAGQLDQEIEQGAWARLSLKPEWLFAQEPQALWGKAMEEISGTT